MITGNRDQTMPIKLLTVALFATCGAAQTFVVDAANGPGTNFTDIAAAVAAVPDGATLLVRPGIYGPFSIAAKGLTLLGGPGVDVTGSGALPPAVEVRNTAAAQSVVVSGVRLASCDGAVSVRNCAGPVLLEGVDASLGTCFLTGTRASSFGIWTCAQVLVSRCVGWNSWAANSDVVFELCTLRGSGSYCLHGSCSHSNPGLELTGGSAQIVSGSLTGGAGFSPLSPFSNNQPALSLIGATARVMAPATLDATGYAGMAPAPAIAGTGSLRLDPAVVLTTTAVPAIASTVGLQTATMPTVLGQSAAPNSTLFAAALGPIGDVVVLVVGLPGAAATVPGFTDAFWIDPAVHHFHAIGVPRPGVPVLGAVAVPNVAALRGLRIAWQAASIGSAGTMASNPTWTLVR